MLLGHLSFICTFCLEYCRNLICWSSIFFFDEALAQECFCVRFVIKLVVFGLRVVAESLNVEAQQMKWKEQYFVIKKKDG